MIDKIFNEDCLEGMKRIEDGTVDMILTDLPYGITDAPFDVRIPFEPMWEQFKRITKHNAAIVLFSQMPFGAELIMSNRKMFRYKWVWQKTMPVGFLNARKMPMRCHEDILIFYRQLPIYNPQMWQSTPYERRCNTHSTNYHIFNGKPHISPPRVSVNGERYPLDIIKFNQPNSGFGSKKKEVFHAQEKPVDLLEYLIKTYTNEGELVLDATIGSGSTAVAAINTNRHFIGFETEKKFYEIAKERIAKARAEKEQALF